MQENYVIDGLALTALKYELLGVLRAALLKGRISGLDSLGALMPWNHSGAMARQLFRYRLMVLAASFFVSLSHSTKV